MSEWFSPYLVAPFAAWLVAQVVKVVLLRASTKTKSKTDVPMFFRSGSMPSAHTSTVIALATVVGLVNGVDSAAFGIAAIMAAVFIYDALILRRSVGEQGEALKKLISQSKLKIDFFNAKGHDFADVLVGGALGMLTAVVVLRIL